MAIKIHEASDLHLEFGAGVNAVTGAPDPFKLAEVDRDVLVLAGDVAVGTKADKFILGHLAKSDVIYILGNHEYYHQVLSKLMWAWKGPTTERINKEAEELDYPGRLHFLEDRTVVLKGTRFIGATLWTDFDGGDATTMEACNRGMNDYRLIKLRNDDLFAMLEEARAHPRDILHIHNRSRDFIIQELEKEFDGPTVVVTHMAPHWDSVHEQFHGSMINGAFYTDLEDLILKYEPELWFHGHMHTSFDYQVGKTRVVCNPRGYAGLEINPTFERDLVIEL